MTNPSHRVSDEGDKVVIHDLEVFCAYDPQIDGDHDEDLTKFDNERVRDIVDSTQQYMRKGSLPRLVVMHERDGKEPKSSVGRFTKIRYEERGGVGYIVGDCEVERPVFDKLLATNAFPRRSAEIWQDQNHLSEVALLGRETPRRPLPDTHFARRGERVTFARSLRFDMGTVGGGQSTYVPGTKDTYMADDIRKELAAMKCDMDEIKSMMKKHFGEGEEKVENADEGADKEEMAADDMLTQQFAEDEKDEMGDLVIKHEDEEAEVFPASRPGRRELFAMRRENARMARELATMKAELSRERFSRDIDAMEQDGYRIPAGRRERLIADLVASKDPETLLDSWRELFARDPMGVRIDMSRASMPAQDIGAREVSDLVREFAGKPEEYRKAINNRSKR
jgi:hypothetical protein